MTQLAWQPTTSLIKRQLRAKLLAEIRQFFAKRNILEVETPLLSQHTVTDVHIQSFATTYLNGSESQFYYLQTSPEYAMKRLLASGSGPIYQICKAFRNGESGRQHNPEFTLLEWYRPDFTHHNLMDEMDEFLQTTINANKAKRITYENLFLDELNINPFFCAINDLQSLTQQLNFKQAHTINDKDTLLQLLFTHIIEPKIGFNAPLFVYNFPPTQAALAKIQVDDKPVAERFELYINGIELANGFHELTQADEQLQRFTNDQHQRKQRRIPIPKVDERLIAALEHGLPACAGVALGIDRLLMIKTKASNISEIINFPWEIA